MKYILTILSFCFIFFYSQAQPPTVDPFSSKKSIVVPTKNYDHLPKFKQFSKEYNPSEHIIAPIEPFDLKSLMETRNRMFIIDTREIEEFEVSHIQGAKQVSYETFTAEKIWMFDENTTIILYSTDGERSAHVAAYMKSMGFADVRVVSGSIIGWVNAGYPVVDKEGKVSKYVMVNDKTEAKELRKGKAFFAEK